MDISRVRKFFGSCRRTEVLEMTGLEGSPATLHGNDRVVKKGLSEAADNDDDMLILSFDDDSEVRKRERERKPVRNGGSGSRLTGSRSYDGNEKKV